jgi:hypothetical protein
MNPLSKPSIDPSTMKSTRKALPQLLPETGLVAVTIDLFGLFSYETDV